MEKNCVAMLCVYQTDRIVGLFYMYVFTPPTHGSCLNHQEEISYEVFIYKNMYTRLYI